MKDVDLNAKMSRRRALGIGGGLTASLITASPLAGAASAIAAKQPRHPAGSKGSAGKLPVKRMQEILEAEGTVTSNGVLTVGIDRTDIGTVSLKGVPIKPSFEVNGDLTFQPLGSGQAFFNGDLPLKDDEIDPFIDAILANGLIFQAEHQHFYDFEPPVWFIHWRGKGDPIALAQAVHDVVKTTSTPLPQMPPANPKTPLDKERLRKILHGYEASVGSDGVVTVFVARRNPIHIEGVHVFPETNIATNIAFEPLNASGSNTAAAPDFAMEGNEIDPLMKVMRAQGWDIGCLYNQETEERPQLFFSHQFKTGDPYRLAEEVRLGLNETNSE